MDGFFLWTNEFAENHNAYTYEAYIPSAIQECALALGFGYFSSQGEDDLSDWEERFYDYYYMRFNYQNFTTNEPPWPVACVSTEMIEWLDMMEYGPQESETGNCVGCAIAYDCTTMPNSFYCADAPPADDPFSQTVALCMEEISWPGTPQTYQHVANLVTYITAASPWMPEDSIPDSCEAAVGAVASFSPGLYPTFLRDIVGIWGTESTSIWGRGSSIAGNWSSPVNFEVPSLSQFPNQAQSSLSKGSDDSDGGSGIGGGNACAEQPCGSGFYWDYGLCQCWVN
jgi:hypothetical protein